MFPLTITLHNTRQLGAVMAALDKLDAAEPTTGAKTQAPGKPSAATTAPSPRTAAAGPAPEPAAPEQKVETPAAPSTAPAADASSASSPAASDAKPFEYVTLQKAVNERVAKFGKDKLLAIAKAHGANTFKDLPADKWEPAYNDVIALGV